MMNQDIINKYNVPVPRYTSYPPANFFTDTYSATQHQSAIEKSNDQKPSSISIYIHLPFCHQICYYCGCNSMLMPDKNILTQYISALKMELKMVMPMLSKKRKIAQIHYGGGTPTAFPIEVLKDINEIILKEFECIERPEIAIECHPGYMDEHYWQQLSEIGFNRVSIGIQDFNCAVLKAINRKPSQLKLIDIMQEMRLKNVSVNLDFIYGLPLQSVSSFKETIIQAIQLKPDRLVTFSYAHVPWVNSLQQKLEAVGLPNTEKKEQMFQQATQLLHESNYKSIGLDHFVLPDDELYLALQNKSLHRNFQGYCTRRTTGQVYAFGVTAISQLANSYCQNTKDIHDYITRISKGELPVFKGYALNQEEQIAREVISTLMCNNLLDWQQVASNLQISINDIKAAINYNPMLLNEMKDDGLITYDEKKIEILPEALPFVRNVAASLDKLMLDSNKKYSKPI